MPIAHKPRLGYAERQEMFVNPIADYGINFDQEGNFRGHLGPRSIQERALKVRGSPARVCRPCSYIGYLAAPFARCPHPPVATSTGVLTSDGDCGYRSADAPSGGALPPRAAGTWLHSSK